MQNINYRNKNEYYKKGFYSNSVLTNYNIILILKLTTTFFTAELISFPNFKLADTVMAS